MRSPQSAFRYPGLTGEELLDRLVAERDLHGLEVLWRLGDPAVASQLVPRLLGLGELEFAGLVIDDLLNPTRGAPVQAATLSALQESLPQLPERTAEALAERLKDDEDPLAVADHENAREVLERLVIVQKCAVGGRFAMSVLRGETPASEAASVRRTAYRRALVKTDLLRTAERLALEAIERERSPAAWADGARLVSVASAVGRLGDVGKLAQGVLRAAPEWGGADLPEPVREFALSDGLGIVEELVAGEGLPDTPGSRSVVGLIEDVVSARDRVRLFVSAVDHQSHLWGKFDPSSWDESEWKRRLKSLTRDEPITTSIAVTLIRDAHATLTAEAIAFAVSQSWEEPGPPLTEAANRLRTRMAALEEQASSDEQLATVPWRIARDASQRESLALVFEHALDVEVWTALVADALVAGRVSASVAPGLLPTGASFVALSRLPDDSLRAEFARALVDQDDDGALPAIARIQTEAFSVLLVAELGPRHPNEAFAGLASSYGDLSSADKDTVCEQLAEWGTVEQMDVFAAVMSETQKGTAHRRILVTRRVASVLEPRSTVPDWMLRLLGSGNNDLRSAAIEALEQIRPWDGDAIRELRSLADRGGVPGELGRRALDAIAADVVGEIRDESLQRDEALELLPLSGATGSPIVIAPLLEFVGPDPRDDDVAVRQTAAAAIAQATEGGSAASIENQERLVSLVEGDEPEVDPIAASHLRRALSNVELGEDAAIALLYDEFLGRRPKATPDVLFGAEKETIVTHLGLLSAAVGAGELGYGRQLGQLDIVTAALARAAYLQHGTSEPLQQQIRESRKHTDYASLIGQIRNTPKMKGIADELGVIRSLRSEKNLEAHPGDPATIDDVTAARQHFKKVVVTCIGLLEKTPP